jgi:rhodanese-related sulfurtransferase
MKIFLLIILGLLAVCTGCGFRNSELPAKEAEYIKISAEQAHEMLADNPDAVLLDVRTSSEFTEKRIPGSILLPDYEIREKAATVLPDKDTLILIYCHSGRRSADAAYELIDMGYTNVYDFGGIIDWPYDTISG